MELLQERLDRGEIIILDGAMGTELQRRGVPMHGVAWSAAALATHPELVRAAHEDYVQAGADIIITNTFSTGRHVLEPAGLGDQFDALNQRAVSLARQAQENAAGDRRVYVAGSISTFYAGNEAASAPSAEQLQANYRDQARTLAEAGVDLIMMEMMGDIEQATYAVKAAVATGLPVWVGFSCRIEDDGTILLWERQDTLASGLEAIVPLGGAAISIMHTLTEDTAPALGVVREHWSGPMAAYAHSGHFKMPDWQFVDLISPEDYAAEALKWVELGVQVIGGCCGTGPEHIRLLKERLPARLLEQGPG